jgi:hypothetical protein
MMVIDASYWRHADAAIFRYFYCHFRCYAAITISPPLFDYFAFIFFIIAVLLIRPLSPPFAAADAIIYRHFHATLMPIYASAILRHDARRRHDDATLPRRFCAATPIFAIFRHAAPLSDASDADITRRHAAFIFDTPLAIESLITPLMPIAAPRFTPLRHYFIRRFFIFADISRFDAYHARHATPLLIISLISRTPLSH